MCTKAKKKEKAIERMKMLRLFYPCIKAFSSRDEVQMSEINGGLYEFHDNATLNAMIDNFEKKYQALVYHVIHTPTSFGELYDFLYVSNDIEEWAEEDVDIKDGYVFVRCENVDNPNFSEFGTIAVRNRSGGLIRN